MRYHAPLSWWDGEPAAVSRKTGAGEFIYIGAWLDEAATKREVSWLLDRSGIHPDGFPVPAGVDVYKRVGSDHDVYIVENMSHEPQKISVPAGMKDALTSKPAGSINLPVYGVALLTRPH